MWWTRLKALIIKELLAVLRDPRGRMILIGPPIIQLLVFSYAATLEVRNVDVLVLNQDAGRWGQELVHRMDGAPTFRRIFHAQSTAALREAIAVMLTIGAIFFLLAARSTRKRIA
jgi:ABC-2 type transport system permease protein